ncbi:MAG: hypothetical protein ACFCUE_12320 [Candidatus Bathyarchaeia archaeon]|jgi:hypothetical protein
MKEEQTNQPSNKGTKKLPEGAGINHKIRRKNASIVKQLKIDAAFKLWKERGFRNITLNVPMTHNGKRVMVKVLARKKGTTVGVECATTVRLERLRQKIATLRGCLPPNSYIIAVFPEIDGKTNEKVKKFVDEVWALGRADDV